MVVAWESIQPHRPSSVWTLRSIVNYQFHHLWCSVTNCTIALDFSQFDMTPYELLSDFESSQHTLASWYWPNSKERSSHLNFVTSRVRRVGILLTVTNTSSMVSHGYSDASPRSIITKLLLTSMEIRLVIATPSFSRKMIKNLNWRMLERKLSLKTIGFKQIVSILS